MPSPSSERRAALKAWYAANLEVVKPPAATPRPVATGRHAPATPPPTPPEPAAHDDAADRRAALEHTRQAARKKSLRWRFAIFCFMLAGTLVAALAIYVLIQQKFGGKIPYFQSID